MLMGSFLQQALIVILFVSGLPLLASSLVAGTLSLLQAVTQVQEQTIVHLLRIISCSLVLIFMATYSIDLFERLLDTALAGVTALGSAVK